MNQSKQGFMVAEMATFAVGTHAFDGGARERLKLSVLDTLGCAIGALGAAPIQAVRRVVASSRRSAAPALAR